MKKPIIDPDPFTPIDFWAPVIQAGQAQITILEETFLPDRVLPPFQTQEFKAWAERFQDCDTESDDFLRMSIGLIYNPDACPACRMEAAMFLSEDFDIVEGFQDLTPEVLADLEARVAWIEHDFRDMEHVCSWAPYRPGVRVRSPLRWAGGKSRVAELIASLLPAHETYAEIFAGGGSLFFAKSPALHEQLNDLDPDVANFYQVVKDCPWELAAEFAWCLISRRVFRALAAMDPEMIDDPVYRAYRFFYLNQAGFGGEMKHPRFSFSANDGGGGNRLVGALDSLDKRLFYASERLRFANAAITHLDWRDCLDQNDRPGTLLYLDPPYLRNSVNYRFNMAGLEAHTELARRLRQAHCSWILSSNDLPEIRELYAGFNILPLAWAAGMPAQHSCQGKRYRNQELLIANFELREPGQVLASEKA